jgi:type II secretory ATPase GspE/PulE/Tfp pilus assembly ATPase PilB-like protein
LVLEALRQKTGLFIVVGPPASGTWTTLVAFMGDLDVLTRSVAVIEEPGRPYLGIKAVDRFPVDPQHAAGMADAFRRALTRKPNVFFCGRLAGAEAVQLAVESSKERLVLATVEANNPVAGIMKLAEFGASRTDLAHRLVAVMGQRLPRKLCADCREAYLPSAEAIRRANLGQFGVERLFRASHHSTHSCQSCRGLGYSGCIPLYEFLPLTQRFRNLLAGNATEREMILDARKEGMESPSEQGLHLMARGLTSADEMRRILQESAL